MNHRLKLPTMKGMSGYAELGFDDGRTENPNKAWVALRSLAEKQGVLRMDTRLGSLGPS
jgi:hypothetical protein